MIVLLSVVLVAWVVFALCCAAVGKGPRRGEEIETGMTLGVIRLYARVFHRLRIVGREHIPRDPHAGPMLVVANHTAGVDPIIVQAACNFEISWMMAADMMVPWAEWVWRWTRVIRVERSMDDGEGRRRGGDSAGLREALRRLEAGDVVGVFPEGKIERPRGNLLPFAGGVGVLALMGAKKCGGSIRILPVVIEDTPYTQTAWGSLWRPSRARLTVLPMVSCDVGGSAEQVTEDLHARFAAVMQG